jgi:peptidoglycan L-alanyl-D-glutamate endopeptidase CwlK
MHYQLGQRSRERLQGVHPDLVRVVERAIQLTSVDFTVLEGLRTTERQKTLVAAGASKTMNSRHITGHAVDLGAYVDGQVDWSWPLYERIAAAMKLAAKELGVAIVCGADWVKFRDGPHFELDRKAYPPV